MIKVFCLLCLFIGSLKSIISQGTVGIGTQNPVPSAILDVQSTTGGLKLPVMNTAQRSGIANPAKGLVVFDTDWATIAIFDGIQWKPLYGSSTSERQPAQYLTSQAVGETITDVDIYDDWMIVGVGNAMVGNVANAGAIDFYKLNGNNWIHQTRIGSPSPQNGAKFGFSVALTNGYAIVGAYGRSVTKNNTTLTNIGASYIYKWNGSAWAIESTLAPIGAAQGDSIGFSVDITWNCSLLAAVGAPRDDSKANNAGAIYLYSGGGGGWSQVAKITHPQQNIGDYLGYSVSVDCNYILAGAPGYDWYRSSQGALSVVRNNIGSVYAFRYQNGLISNIQQWYCPIDKTGAEFGNCVTNIQTDFLAGAPGANTVFKLSVSSAFSQNAFYPPSGSENIAFGTSLKMHGGKVAIGGPQRSYNPDYPEQGAVFIYDSQSRSQLYILKKAPEDAYERFGEKVAIFGNRYGIAGNYKGIFTGLW
jgi:hypothetical protein